MKFFKAQQNRGEQILSWICLQIATLGPIGYLPAPGTMGTLCAIPLFMWLRSFEARWTFIDEGALIGLLLLAATWIVHKAQVRCDEEDPSEIIIDEVIGFFAVMTLLPLRSLVVVIAFIYFRFFDIVKPFGIDGLQSMGGAWGIMLDDAAAAFFARLLLEFTFLIIGF